MKEFVTALRVFLVLSFVTGALYPIATYCLGQLLFSEKANGSLISKGEVVIGSRLVGQSFSRPEFFHSRPSATSPIPYNPKASSGSNLAPSNPALRTQVEERLAGVKGLPIDLVTTSGSGLDPHISPQAARVQIDRIARARKIPRKTVEELVESSIEPRTLGLLGEPRINVLLLNLKLESLGTEK